MATLNENDYYLSVGGTDVSSYVVDVTLEPSVTSQDVTAGSGSDWVNRAEGLKDCTISFTLAYDDASGYAFSILQGEKQIIYGPEGNSSGAPKHTQYFILTGAPHTVNVSKEMVTFSVSGEGSQDPTDNMFAGATWS